MHPDLRPALVSTLVFTAACCGAYPLLVFGIGQLAFHHQANGSLIQDASGRVEGSRLIGQSFSGPRYFHSRPSAAGNGYDGMASGGSNLGPTSQRLRDQVAARVAAYRAANNLPEAEPVPADAVTASASGLDPHISPRNAAIQARRVARERGLGIEAVQAAIARHTSGPDWGIFGEAGVNVLELNRDLDRSRQGR